MTLKEGKKKQYSKLESVLEVSNKFLEVHNVADYFIEPDKGICPNLEKHYIQKCWLSRGIISHHDSEK